MAYLSDLTDKQWQKIKHLFDNDNYGNRQKWDKRLLMNAVLYLLKSGTEINSTKSCAFTKSVHLVIISCQDTKAVIPHF
ncbi:transposase [Enterococcus faecalis]|uniref:transposase n=1 Tax=Enterococcus faecalis TaxID=1351 RepID=UPI003D11BFAD